MLTIGISNNHVYDGQRLANLIVHYVRSTVDLSMHTFSDCQLFGAVNYCFYLRCVKCHRLQRERSDSDSCGCRSAMCEYKLLLNIHQIPEGYLTK